MLSIKLPKQCHARYSNWSCPWNWPQETQSLHRSWLPEVSQQRRVPSSKWMRTSFNKTLRPFTKQNCLASWPNESISSGHFTNWWRGNNSEKYHEVFFEIQPQLRHTTPSHTLFVMVPTLVSVAGAIPHTPIVYVPAHVYHKKAHKPGNDQSPTAKEPPPAKSKPVNAQPVQITLPEPDQGETEFWEQELACAFTTRYN